MDRFPYMVEGIRVQNEAQAVVLASRYARLYGRPIAVRARSVASCADVEQFQVDHTGNRFALYRTTHHG